MSIKIITSNIRVCDNCGKEIKGRLVAHTCPCCGAEICNGCQQEKDKKVKEGIIGPDDAAPVEEKEEPHQPDRPQRRLRNKQGSPAKVEADESDPLATFHLHTPEGNWSDYRIEYQGTEFISKIMIDGVLQALGGLPKEEAIAKVKAYPDSDNKKMILGILEA